MKHTKRISGAVLSLSVLCQLASGVLPALPAAAAQTAQTDLAAFTGLVREITQTDTEKDIFQEIVYDPAAGTLTVDGGESKTAYGDLRIRGGVLQLKTGNTAQGGIGAQSAGGYEPFDDAAAEYGYTAEETGSTVTITNEFQTARLIVKAAGKLNPHGAVSAAEGYRDLHILQYDSPEAAYAAYQLYRDAANVQYVQPSRRVQLDAQAIADAQAWTEAALQDTTDHTYNTWGAAMIGTENFISEYLDAELLPEVIVAVIDTGISTTPALFDGRIVDGGVNISNSGDDTFADDQYHGTHVSGTICELTPSNVKIMPIKTFDKDGSASEEQIYLGIIRAIEQGADVLNMSFGGLGISPLEIEAMEIADEAGLICCAAAGNNDDDAGYYYPGSIETCITVGAVDAAMERASFSNTGKMLDVVAPGVGILSYVPGDTEKKEQKNGTSMATPHVSACCALLRSYDKSITPRRAEALLRVNAADLGTPGFDDDFGWGFVNMADFKWDDGICAAPEFSRKSGNYGTAQTVSVETETEDAEIYYTTDGTLPTPENGMLYTEPLHITETTHLQAVTVKAGYVSSVSAEAVYSIGGLDVPNAFRVQDGVLLECRSIRKQLTVPDIIDGEPITAVADGAFAGNHFIEQVTLPDAVTVLGADAFADCPLLRKLNAPGVTEIGARCFQNAAALTAVNIADQLTAVGTAAFSGCAALTACALAGIDALPNQLFEGCSLLQTVEIPDAKRIGSGVFSGCAALTRIDADWQCITAIGSRAFENCISWQGDLSLNALESLGSEAFLGDSALLRVSLPERITVLPAYVFADCAGLRLLQLPGITQIEDSALAVGSVRSDLETELDYTKVTQIGTNAFYGFRIGSGKDTVLFPALETIGFRMFAGVSAGALCFPSATAVLKDAFADAEVSCVYLEAAQKLETGSVKGCRALVLTGQTTEIAADAYTEGTWIVTLDEIPALAQAASYSLSNEPLVMGTLTQQVVLTQHASFAMRVLACGTSLRYQWHRVTAETVTEIDGETEAYLIPDTAVPGTYQYLCTITDAGGNTEQVMFDITVSDAGDFETLEPDAMSFGSGTAVQSFVLEVPESGSYQITASGAAAVSGTLSDAAGQPLAVFTQTAYGSTLTAALTAGETYYLSASGRWNGIYALRLSGITAAENDLRNCTVTLSENSAPVYGEVYQPDVTVTAPDGSTLRNGRDYITRAEKHNQYSIVSVFGNGDYTGYAQSTLAVYPRVPADTAIPVSLESASDAAVFLFVPKVTGTYHYYATYANGYAEERAAYYRTGRYPNGSRYAAIRTKAVVADTPDGSGIIYAENDFSPATGLYFNDTVTLYAGQPYYLICTAESAAEYALVLSMEQLNLKNAAVTGSFMANYKEGVPYSPNVTVKLNGEILTEGVDYQKIDRYSDTPGKATVTIVGMGRYIGEIERQYEILYSDDADTVELTALDTPVRVTCADSRLTKIWFQAESGTAANSQVRYRVINERVSGVSMMYRLYRYDAQTNTYALMSAMDGEANDYLLKNGTYCVIAFRQYAQQTGTANFTVMLPYSLDDAVMYVGDAPYTGSEIEVPLQIISADGRAMMKDRDYTVTYPDDHVMFGTLRFYVRPTNRSYGMQNGTFEIYVKLPDEAPELTIGEHETYVTLNDRLAIYRVSPQTDMTYTLASSDVPNIVLRVFSPDAEMLEQAYGTGTRSLSFTVPAGETRFIMIKFNGTDREGTIHFQLETTLRLLSDCEIETEPQLWTGERVLPDVHFYDGEYELQEGIDYSLRYTTNDVSIGTATANFIGMGTYFGVCDVDYPIITPELAALDLRAFPLRTDEMYAAYWEEEDTYLLYSYTPGIETELHVNFMDALCRLTVQLYNADGAFLDYLYFRGTAETDIPLAAGETCYFLISATDISSTNQSFGMFLSDTGNTDLKYVNDKENGVTYRVSEARGYAEVYALDPSAEQVTLLPEFNGIAVSYTPESAFTDVSRETVVVGYQGCAAAEYAGFYHFIYQQILKPDTQVTGDLNGDGICSEADAVLLQAVLTEHDAVLPELVDWSCADVNGDGILDLFDLLALLLLIS